jgi:hypothetical protein
VPHCDTMPRGESPHVTFCRTSVRPQRITMRALPSLKLLHQSRQSVSTEPTLRGSAAANLGQIRLHVDVAASVQILISRRES